MKALRAPGEKRMRRATRLLRKLGECRMELGASPPLWNQRDKVISADLTRVGTGTGLGLVRASSQDGLLAFVRGEGFMTCEQALECLLPDLQLRGLTIDLAFAELRVRAGTDRWDPMVILCSKVPRSPVESRCVIEVPKQGLEVVKIDGQPANHAYVVDASAGWRMSGQQCEGLVLHDGWDGCVSILSRPVLEECGARIAIITSDHLRVNDVGLTTCSVIPCVPGPGPPGTFRVVLPPVDAGQGEEVGAFWNGE
jgi:hypothetical protein